MSNRPRHHEDEDDDLHDRGLAFDLATLMRRRRALKLFTGAAVGTAALAVVGCGDDQPAAATATSSGANSAAGATGTTGTVATATGGSGSGSGAATAVVSAIPTQATPASSCTTTIPKETGGPFPGDGSKGPNILTQSGIVRSDIRSSFGTSSTLAKGVPLTVKLTVVDTKNACKPIAGAAVYIWHCDIDGLYSMYSQGVTDENYLRGVEAADANGVVTFTSVFPGCYSGRWPHIHFEVYPSLAAANSSKNATATSQLALPEDVSKLVYATTGYSQSVSNLSRITLKTDNVFSDGWVLQTPVMSGDLNSGYTAALTVGV